MDAEDKFHAHLDVCRQCREEIFNLCITGANLLADVAKAGVAEFRSLEQWNRVLRNANGGTQ